MNSFRKWDAIEILTWSKRRNRSDWNIELTVDVPTRCMWTICPKINFHLQVILRNKCAAVKDINVYLKESDTSTIRKSVEDVTHYDVTETFLWRQARKGENIHNTFRRKYYSIHWIYARWSMTIKFFFIFFILTVSFPLKTTDDVKGTAIIIMLRMMSLLIRRSTRLQMRS